MRTIVISMIALCIAVQSSNASACGYCHGDQLAAVYDGSVVADAHKAGKNVAYVSIDGTFGGTAKELKQLTDAVASSIGTVPRSVFISKAPAAARFLFLAKMGNAVVHVMSANKTLAARKATFHLTLLKSE